MRALTVWQPYLAGILHGDGWCTNLTLGLRVKDRDFADAFCAAINEGFGLSVSPKRDERGYWLTRIGNKSGRFSHLRAFEPRTDTEKAAWVRGLFDSEGNACIIRTKRGPESFHRRISMSSTRVETLETASDHLGALGIISQIRATKSHLHPSHKGTKVVFELKVLRRPSMQAFAAVVGSSIGRKQATLNLISSTFQADPSEAARRKQRIGAATRHRRTMTVTLPSVVHGIANLIADGVKPTQRNCRPIPGYNTIQRHIPQARLVAMALGEDA